jgi:prepilin-type N-terminal cleavage/methylation domain-containing protein
MKETEISKPKFIPLRTRSAAGFTTGFTIIEILVVIGIIAILTVIIFPSVYRIRAKNRDSEKISDIATIQLGLSLYNGQKDVYPENLDNISPKYIPSDALVSPNSDEYIYVPLKRNGSEKCTYYHLGVLLELPNPQISTSDTFSSKVNEVDNNYEYCGTYTGPGIEPVGYMYHVRPN